MHLVTHITLCTRPSCAITSCFLTTRQLNENTKRIGSQASDYIDCIFIDCDDMQRGWVQDC